MSNSTDCWDYFQLHYLVCAFHRGQYCRSERQRLREAKAARAQLDTTAGEKSPNTAFSEVAFLQWGCPLNCTKQEEGVNRTHLGTPDAKEMPSRVFPSHNLTLPSSGEGFLERRDLQGSKSPPSLLLVVIASPLGLLKPGCGPHVSLSSLNLACWNSIENVWYDLC